MIATPAGLYFFFFNDTATTEIYTLSLHDALPIYRVLLDDRLAQAVARAERDGQAFALAMFDLDRFKLVNDSFGHRAGDELLKEVAHRLAGVARTTDTLARLGGDEFVIVIDRIVQREDAEQAARRAVEELRSPIR